jgi:hypothetical protein
LKIVKINKVVTKSSIFLTVATCEELLNLFF